MQYPYGGAQNGGSSPNILETEVQNNSEQQQQQQHQKKAPTHAPQPPRWAKTIFRFLDLNSGVLNSFALDLWCETICITLFSKFLT